MIRLFHSCLFIFLSISYLSGQNETYKSLVEKADFKSAMEVAKTPIEKILCYLELDQFSEADSLLEANPVVENDSLYGTYCLYQCKCKRRLRKYDESAKWIDLGLKATYENTVLHQSILENRAYTYIIKGQVEKGQAMVEAILAKKIEYDANPLKIALSYNNLAIAHYYKKEFKKANATLEKALEQTDKLAAPCYYASKLLGNKGVFENKLGNIEGALTTYERSLALKKQLVDGPYNPALYIIYNNIIIIHKAKRNYQKFANYLDTMELIMENSPDNAAWAAQLYINKAFSKNDPVEKEKEINKILQLEPKFLPAERINLVTAYNLLFEIAYRKSDNTECDNYIDKAMQTLHSIPHYSKAREARILRRKALLEKSRRNYNLAYKTIHESIEVFREENGPLHYNLRLPLLTLSEINIKLEKYEEAKIQAKKILAIDEKAFGENSAITSTYYFLNGKIEALQGNYNKAIPFLEEAIKRAKDHDEMKYFIVDKAYMYLSTCYAELGQKAKAFTAQMEMIKLWEFETGKKQVKNSNNIPAHFYYRALENFERHLEFLKKYDKITKKEIAIFFELYNKMKSDYFYETANLDLKKGVRQMFEMGIAHQYEAYQKNQQPTELNLIFELMETYKRGLVDLRLDTKKSDAQFPEHLLQKEQEIRYNYELALQEYRAASENQNNTKIDSTLQSTLFKWQNEKIDFLKKIEKDHPEFYEARSGGKQLSLKEIQHEIKNGAQKYLSFFTGDEFSYGMFVSADTTSIFKLNSEEVTNVTNALIQNLSVEEAQNSELSFSKNKSDFIQNASELYQLLIQPIESHLNQDDNLCIIPDAQLFYLPFDILLTSKVDSTASYKSLPYLINKVNIHYASSLNNNLSISNNKITKGQKYIGFAPETAGRIAYSNFRDQQLLLANKSEIEYGAKHFSGNGYYGKQASKENFLQHAPDASILHLATHASVNDEVPMNSSLHFFSDSLDQSLKIHEIAQLDLNNSLVVLSACETQSGEIASGEGLLSITRAFQLAGSHNIINTLWSVNDKVAEKIINQFWAHQKEGNANSLRKSKLHYLENCSELYAHPFYWSSFTYMGANEPVQGTTNNLFYLGITLFLGVISFLFLKFKK